MKKLCLSIMIIAMCLPLWGYTLKGGVTYTVETARKEAFTNVEYTLPKSIIEANMFDPNFKENVKAIKLGIKETDDRYISHYTFGGYGVVYKKNRYYEFYYNNDGKLEEIGKRIGLKCPTKSYKYDTSGKLVEVVLYVSTKEGYIFDSNRKLKAFGIGNKIYDLNGKIITEIH